MRRCRGFSRFARDKADGAATAPSCEAYSGGRLEGVVFDIRGSVKAHKQDGIHVMA